MQTLTNWTKGLVNYGLTMLVGSLILTTVDTAFGDQLFEEPPAEETCPCDYSTFLNSRDIPHADVFCNTRVDAIANVLPSRSTRANKFDFVTYDRKGFIKNNTEFRLYERGLYVDPGSDVVRYGPTCSVVAFSGKRVNTKTYQPIKTEGEYRACAKSVSKIAQETASLTVAYGQVDEPQCQDAQGLGNVVDNWEWKFGDEYALFNEPVLVGLEPALPPYCVNPTTGTQIACPY